MSRSACARVLAGAVVATSLLAGSLVALANGTAGCNAWTDPKGDSTTGQEGIPGTEDSQLDIVGASFGTVGDSLVATITTAGLSDSSSDTGDEFAFDFTIAGQRMQMYVDRTAPLGEQVNVSAAVFNRTTTSTPDGVVVAVFDLKTKTVRMTTKLSELQKAVGKPVADQPVTALVATTADHVDGFVLFGYDDAPTKLSPVIGVECGGTAAPAAAASGSPSPSPSATSSASPTASSSPSPTASGSASPGASAGASAAGLPDPACADIKDVKGDASPNATNPGAPTPNDPDLDILAVNFKTEPDAIKGFIRVDKLGAKAQLGNGHRFDVTFTAGGKVVEMYAGQPDAVAAGANAALVGAGQSAPAAGGVRIATVYNPTIKLTSVFDVKTSTITLSADRAALDKVLGGALTAGAVVTATAGRSRIFTPTAGSLLADTAQAAKADEQVYRIGDNRCFAAVAAPAATSTAGLVVSAPSRVQTSDLQDVTVRFTTADGKPVSGATVTGRLGSGRTVSAKTSTQGTALLRVPVTVKAGTHQLVVQSGKATVRRTTTVLAERSLLAYTVSGSGSTRLVRVTLTDDDRPTKHPYAEAAVTFAYSGKKVTLRTDRNGQAAVRVQRGTSIDMTYAGRPGFVTSAKRQTTAG